MKGFYTTGFNVIPQVVLKVDMNNEYDLKVNKLDSIK